MPEHVVLSAAAWLRDGERIRGWPDPRPVAPRGGQGAQRTGLRHAPARPVRAAPDRRDALATTGVEMPRACRVLTTLTSLRLGPQRRERQTARPSWPTACTSAELESLVLRDNGVTLLGAMYLMHSKRLPRLKTLDLSANAIDAPGVEVIRGSKMASAIDVDVSDQQPPAPWSRRPAGDGEVVQEGSPWMTPEPTRPAIPQAIHGPFIARTITAIDSSCRSISAETKRIVWLRSLRRGPQADVLGRAGHPAK